MGTAIGYIGIGAMGGPMARNLLKAGFDVIVYDLNGDLVDALAGAGAQRGESVRDVADRAEIVMVCLNTIQAGFEVAKEASQGSAIRIYVDQSTTGPTVAAEIRQILEGAQVQMLDAPISGGTKGAAAGTLSVMASGPHHAFDTVKPAFDAIGRNVFYLGDNPGNGQMMKVINNYLGNVAKIATAEALTLGVKFGLDAKTMIDVLRVSTGRNGHIEDGIGDAIRTGRLESGGNMAISYKDIKAALDEAKRLGTPTDTAARLPDIYSDALANGGDKERSVAIINHVAAKGGIKLVG
jgi:3-hydroxyisobutyrate dehydrogenase